MSHLPHQLVAAAGAGLLLITAILPAAPAQAQAQEPPFNRGTDTACRADNEAGATFVDVPADSVHARAIDCLWIYQIARGSLDDGDTVFSPRQTVSRQQMASFLARTIDSVPAQVYALPVDDGSATDPPFEDADDISTAHEASVSRLTDAGIIDGFTDGTFGPGETLTRAQMATFIVSAVEAITSTPLEPADVFDDLTAPHDTNIRKLASIGVTAGTGPGTYEPAAPITRAAMASFLARTLDHLADVDLFDPIAFAVGTGVTLGLTDVDLGVRDDADRVTFTVEGDDDLAGWRIGYVDEATEQGTGNPIDVGGDAILRVILTGMAYPFDLPDDVADRRWVQDRVAFDGGAAIVEVVDDSVFEGQQVLFIGTTGKLPFTVQRLEDPQRIYINISHPG